ERELSFKEGDYYSDELQRESITKLYEMGIFESVRITPIFLEDERLPYLDYEVAVREVQPGLLEGGPGLRSEDGLRGFGKLTYSNLWGRAHQFSIDGEINRKLNNYQFLEYKVEASYTEPWLFELFPVRNKFVV